VRYRDCRFEAGGRRQEAGRSAPHYSEKGCNICMIFEYDPKKAKINRQKYGISFAEAEMVFFDPLAIHDVDPD